MSRAAAISSVDDIIQTAVGSVMAKLAPKIAKVIAEAASYRDDQVKKAPPAEAARVVVARPPVVRKRAVAAKGGQFMLR